MKTQKIYPSKLENFTDRELRSLAGELFTLINWGINSVEVQKKVEGIEYTEISNPIRLKKEVNQEITRRHEISH